jgi:transmembrane sensor
MLVTRELIQRFFDNNCTKEEADKVADHLEKNPHVLNEYIQQDWNGVEDEAALPAGVSEEMLREIRAVLFPRAVIRKLGRPMWWAAAAVLIVVAGLVLSRMGGRHVAVASERPGHVKDTTMVPVTGIYRLVHNKGNAAQHIILPDGSEAVLAVNSTLRYKEPFADSARAVELEGEARFTVAKHDRQPFSVTAGPVRTLVLGTIFTMAENASGITVKLHCGKVKVQSGTPGLRGWQKDVVMTPGETMVYTITSGLVVLSGPEKVAPAVVADHKESLVFHHIPLSKVLDQLAARYHKSIEYDSEELSDLYFSGTVLPADSLLTMLQVMTHMNELMIEERSNRYLIRKKLP